MHFDVVVVGSGAAGMTTAIVAADAGLSVCILEKSKYVGGSTAYSGGGVNIPNNAHMNALGLQDDPELARTYYRGLMGNFYDADKIDAFLANAPAMLTYMEGATHVRFSALPMPDYEPWREGAVLGRQVFAQAFDGTRLGARLKDLRRPWPQLGLFGDMQIRTQEVGVFVNMFSSPSAFKTASGLILRHFGQKLRHGRGTRLCMGNALAGRLFLSVLDRGIPILTNAAAESLVTTEGAVTGVKIRHAGKAETVGARKAVVLASGGFGGSAKLRAAYYPAGNQGPSLSPESAEGDGLRMGLATGASLVTDNISNGNWVPMSTLKTSGAPDLYFPHLALDRHSAGTLTVDESGRRFVNEGSNYQAFCNAMHTHNLRCAYIIAGEGFVARKGLGLARPAPLPRARFVSSGYLIRERTLDVLAQRLGMDPVVLTATVDRFNSYAQSGHDPEFKRGDDLYSARLGGGVGLPNPGLAPLGNGPYYALRIESGSLTSFCGLATNANAQVLTENAQVIPGLYAVGADANSVFRGAYPTGGSSLGPAMTFGYVAGRHIAGKAGASTST